MNQPPWLPELAYIGGTREEAITLLYRVFVEDVRRFDASSMVDG